MKHFISILLLALFSFVELSAQEIVKENQLTPRGRTLPYNTSELAQVNAGVAVKSHYLRPLVEWSRQDEADAVVFTAQYAAPFSWMGRQTMVCIAEASGAYEVVVNGQKVGYTANVFSPAEFDVTKLNKQDMNSVQVRILKKHWSRGLESWVQSEEPRVGEAYVISQPTIRIRDFVHSTRMDVSATKANIELGVIVKTESLNPKKARIHYEIVAPDTTVVTYGHQDVVLEMRGEDTVKVFTQLPVEKLWCAESPTLYRLNLKTQIEGRYVEYQTHMVGFRAVDLEGGQLLVNGRGVQLNCRELSTRASDEQLASVRTSGYNTVRFRDGAITHELFSKCDSLGLYVLAQLPINTSNSGVSRKEGGNLSNNPEWLEAYLERVKDFYYTTRNYSSVVGYILADGSANGINLYESYLLLKSLELRRPVLYAENGGEWNSD